MKITLTTPVCIKTFTVVVHLICILPHDAAKETEGERDGRGELE